MAEGLAFGWDDEIEESEYEILPDGDYHFTVTNFDRAYFEPKSPDSKIGACQQANVEFTIEWVNAQGVPKTNKITHRLKLWKTLEFMIYDFFKCIGLRKSGDGKTRMPWGEIIGKTGICAIGHHTDSKGNDYNDVTKCYAPEMAPTVTKNDNTAQAPESKFKL